MLDDLIDGFAGEARIASERLGSFRMGCESAAVMRDLPIGSAAPTNPLESIAAESDLAVLSCSFPPLGARANASMQNSRFLSQIGRAHV